MGEDISSDPAWNLFTMWTISLDDKEVGSVYLVGFFSPSIYDWWCSGCFSVVIMVNAWCVYSSVGVFASVLGGGGFLTLLYAHKKGYYRLHEACQVQKAKHWSMFADARTSSSYLRCRQFFGRPRKNFRIFVNLNSSKLPKAQKNSVCILIWVSHEKTWVLCFG